MDKMTIILLTLTTLFTVGCSNQAKQGQGGFAEHNFSQAQDHRVGLENALYFEQQMSNRHLDTLVLAGAKMCFPAAVHTLTVRKTRIARALQGGLDTDAANDLIIQRDQLARLERRLNYVQLQGTCVITPRGNQEIIPAMKSNTIPLNKTMRQKIDALLNNNNQFVLNSAELNPRYIGQLAEVTELLRDYPDYQLKITGHTDTTGSNTANLKLSLQRARQVERYLLIFGLSPNNIIVNGDGATSPLFSGEQPQVRLVNRRVSIELLEGESTQEVSK